MARKERTKYEIECAERAQKAAEDRGFTQERVADALGMTQGAVGQYYNGPLSINMKFLVNFCRVIRCSPSEIDPEKRIFNMFNSVEDDIISMLRSADESELPALRRVVEALVAKK
jgi:transcriptional regulator with XRE-family HTH domain